MRLIDADHLRKWIIANWGNGWHSKTVDDILDQIDREDTYFKDADIVDVEPIRHGHWEKSKDDNDRWRCSHCGNVYIGFNGINSTFAEICYYCPHCGAKMDEVKGEKK